MKLSGSRYHVVSTVAIWLFGGLVNNVLLCSDCLEEPYFLSKTFFIGYSYSGFAWALFWKGSEILVEVLNIKLPWVDAPAKRFVASLASICIWVFIVVWGLDVTYDMIYFHKSFERAIQSSGVPYKDALLITLSFNVFMHGRSFLYSWRQAAIDVERLKTEQVSTQYESLKNQVNPHFLFNSLNALSSLVYDDQAKAVEFIRKLSQVYRYVLDKKDEELVPLNDELDFARNYLFLQKIRFGDNLQILVEGSAENRFVPPLAIQLLIENAIKHNVVSEAYPLEIKVSVSEEYCEVKNTLKEKLEKDSTGIGLENLKARYQYLSRQEVVIHKGDHIFSVKLPLLKMEK